MVIKRRIFEEFLGYMIVLRVKFEKEFTFNQSLMNINLKIDLLL